MAKRGITKHILLLFICIFSSSSTTSVNECNTDKDPFIKLGNKYYLINAAVQLSWHQAFLFCRTYDSDLATIESEVEMNALSSYLITNGHSTKHFWIGANDYADEGKFMSYKSGRPMVYTKWSGGQPDNAGNIEDCVHLWHINNNNMFEMNDWSCADGKNIICELPKPQKCCRVERISNCGLKKLAEIFAQSANVLDCIE
ncbi:C-type lectin 37Db-like [Ceratitis capitata]|uniref:C-type lectin 37Db-like n=1 Tax=Ceratitis capitata TaxID=7213 RepID=UPI000C6C40E7|nr:C-type lectin 37Db-like [Ceratitis capitata]